MNALHCQLVFARHLSLKGIQGMQQSNGERGTRPHAAASRKITIMVNFYSSINFEIAQDFPNRRVCDVFDRLAILHLGVDNAVSVFKEGRQITTGDIAVFVDRRSQYGASMSLVP